MDWDHEVDVVAAGSGIGGMAAAITAVDHGGTALVLEKAHGLGGVTGWSLGQLWVGANHLAQAAGIPDSAAETDAYIGFIGASHSDPALRRAFVDGAPAAISYFMDAVGIEFELVRGMPDYFYTGHPAGKAEGRYLEVKPFPLERLGAAANKLLPSPHRFGSFTSADMLATMGDRDAMAKRIAEHLNRNERCAGAGLMAALLNAALERAVEFWVSSPVTELLTDAEGRVVGVVAVTPSGEKRIRARKGVVLATGGYDHNAELVRTFEHHEAILSMSPDTVEGDHLILAGALGAAVGVLPRDLTPTPLGIRVPDATGGEPYDQSYQPGKPHCIVVNGQGLRFADEAFYLDYEPALNILDGRHRRPRNWPAWLILDQNHRDSYDLATIPPGAPLPEGMATTADTLEELAAGAGIDTAGLRSTVERYNGFCESGVDPDFLRGKYPYSNIFLGDPRAVPNPNMGPIARPPFYAIPLHRVGLGFASAGLRTKEVGEVLDVKGSPIRGLHAVGNAAARLDIGGYNSGMGNTRGLLFGHLSAKHLMESGAR
ncbi:FAD-dependent oxidoreductase [Rhodococcus sp. NPDC056960]